MFTQERDVKRHQDTVGIHKNVRERSYQPICQEPTCKHFGKTYSRPDNYERHVRNMHR